MAQADLSDSQLFVRRDATEIRLPLPVRLRLPLDGRMFEFCLVDWLARAMAAVLLGAVGFAIYWFATRGVGWFDVAIFALMAWINGLGITVGLHRLFTHGAFHPNRAWRLILGIWGAMAMQGPILYWVSIHRKHHRHADAREDPHAPLWEAGPGVGAGRRMLGAYRGFVGWMFDGSFRLYPEYVRDLKTDADVIWLDRFYFLWIGLGILLPGLAGLAWSGTLDGAISAMLAGGPIRIFYGLVATGCVNAFAHGKGARPFRVGDASCNRPWVNLVSWIGEGLHNNHHAFPGAAKFNLLPGQVDPGYGFIRLLEICGWAKQVKRVAPVAIAKRRAA